MNKIYATGYKLPLHNLSKPKLNIVFFEKQQYFDNNLYPVDRFYKYITNFNKTKEKFKNQEKFAEAISTVYKYHSLKMQFSSTAIANPDINKKHKSISRWETEKILSYDFFYPSTITLLEYFLNFDLLNEKSKILMVTLTNGYLEAIVFYLEKYLHSKNFKRIEIIIPAYIVGDRFDFSMLKKVVELFNLNYVILNRPLNNGTINSFLDSGKKYDFILLDPHINDPELVYFRDQLNHTFMVSELCLGLSALKKGGNLLFVIPNITTKLLHKLFIF